MQKSEIPYASTGFFSKIIVDYLNGEETVKPFYTSPPEISSFKKAIAEKQKEKIDRSKLTETILHQYKKAGIKGAEKQIEVFKNENTFCIVTAHQLNIFTGPLYVIYKTISTIQACKTLQEQYPAYNFIPVFWLGSEDHDFDEINHFSIFHKTFTWHKQTRGAAGRLSPASISGVMSELKAVLGESEPAKYLYAVFNNAYLNSESLAQATLQYLHAFFGNKGLVILDGDNSYFKNACIEIIEDEISCQSSFSIVSKTCERLSVNYTVQANPREINLFYLDEGLRERIVFNAEDRRYSVLNTEIAFTPEEIVKEINTNPQHFSPNVILRPVFQQKVLPSLGYVGGGGELSYWLQLKDLFQHHKVSFPVLLLRNSVLIIDKTVSAKIKKLNLQPHHFFAEEETLIKNYLKTNAVVSLSLEKQKQDIEKIFQEISIQAVQVDSSLENAVMAEKQNMLNTLQKLEAKLIKAEKLKSETGINQVKNIKNKLFPGGQLQERKENFMQYYTQYGDKFFSLLYATVNPFNKNFTILEDTGP